MHANIVFMLSFDVCKDDENMKAIKLLEHVIGTADAITDEGEHIEHLIKGIFSGNIFDLGAAQVFSPPWRLVFWLIDIA